jgi:hypothetical protein
MPSIAPAKIHRITQSQTWAVWKVEMVIPGSGLRPNQWPRVWFVVEGDSIAFLKVASHTENYNNVECERVAIGRATDLF